MRRRAFLLSIPCGALALLAQEKPEIPENVFSHTYNNWVAERAEAAKQAAISVREMRLWKDVKESWSKLRSHIDQAYG